MTCWGRVPHNPGAPARHSAPREHNKTKSPICGAQGCAPQRKPRWMDSSPTLGRGGRRGGAEYFADFAGQVLQGERFLQEIFWAFGLDVACDGVFGVAGEIEDFDAGTGGDELLDEFVAAETGHNDVCDDEINGIEVAGGEG